MSLDLSALDVTFQATGVDTVLAGFQAVDEAGAAIAAKEVGTVPFTTPGLAEMAAGVSRATQLLNAMGITARSVATGVNAVSVADRDLTNAQNILAKSGLEVEAVSKAEAIALREQAVAARAAAAAMAEASRASNQFHAAPGVTFRGAEPPRAAPPIGAFRSSGGEPPEEPPPAPPGPSPEEEAGIAETTSLYGGLAAQLIELIAVYEAYRAIRDAVVAGGQFDASIESARLGIAAITQAYGTLTDAQGTVLTGQNALAAAFSIADVQLQALQADAVRVAIPFQTLADIFRGIEGAALKTGASLDQIRQLVTSASLAATALGTPYEQLNTTLVQLLEGHVRVTNQLVAHLGLSNQIVHEWQQQGTLIPNLLATFEKFNGVGEQVQGTWRGISAEIKNAFDIFTGTAIRPALTTLEEGLRDVLGEVIDTSTGKVSEAFSGLEQYVGAGFNLIARGIVEGLKAAVEMAKEVSGWLAKNRTTMLNLVSGAAALAEGIGAVVKEAISIVAPLEAAYLTSGLVLIPIKTMGYLLAAVVDAVHLLGAAFSGAGFLFMNLILTPLDLFNESLGKALNFIHAGLGDGLIEAGKDGEAALKKIEAPALAMLDTIKSGGLEVQKFGRNWDAAQADATKAADAIQKAIADSAKALANLHLTPPPPGGDTKDVASRVAAAIEAAKSAAELAKQYLDSALADNEVSYRDYFDELTRTEIASLDKQIKAKRELLAAAKPEQQPKIEADIAALEVQRTTVRLENERKYQAAIAETNAKINQYIAEQRKAEGDEFTARLGQIGKEAEAYDQALAREGVADNERRARIQAFVQAESEAAQAADLQQTIATQLTQIEQTRLLIHTQLRDRIITQADATRQLTALQSGNLTQITQELNELESIAALLKDPKLMNAVITLRLRLLNEDGKELTDMEQLQKQFADAVGKSIADGVGQGFAEAFKTGSIAKGFAAFGAAMLGGLGAAMVQFGEAALVQSTFMQTLLTSLASLNPAAGIAISLAMIAVGEALQAAAASAFGGGGSSGGGAPAGIGGPQTINIALPGGVGPGNFPAAQPPATAPGTPSPLLPSGSLGSFLPTPQVALPPSGSLATAGPPMNIQIVTLGRWSPQMQQEAMQEIRLAMRRGL